MKYTHWALKFSNYDDSKSEHIKPKLHYTRREAMLARNIFISIYAKKIDLSDVKIKVIKVHSQPIECADNAERVR
tara:strand:+ start:42 stop:266 length:225 start_codon:yes stop_codon:yes gene_type:complete